MVIRLLSFFVITFLIVPLFAQVSAQGTISGSVVDASDGEPLPGATVQIDVLNIGTNVDVDGTYTLSDVPEGSHEVMFRFVGYLEFTTEISVSDGEEVTLDAELQPDVLGLDELVVTGLGIRQQRGRTQTSIGRVDAADITARSEFNNFSQLVSGRVAGVSAQASSGNIGSGIRFNVRGGGGLGGDGQPVIYIDGVRVDNNEVVGFGAGGQGTSPLADLNPNDIENIEIIRGPAGAAIYGTEGANGVVLVETKSGSFFDEPTLNFQYRGTYGYSEQGREYDDELYQTADEANDIFITGDLQSHNLSASGGADAYRYFASVENRQEGGILPRTEGNRTNMRANFEVFPTEDVNIRANAGYTINTLERPDNDNNVQGYLGNTLLLPTSYLFTDSTAINQMEDIQRVSRFVGSLRASWSPMDGLDLSATAGYDASSRRQDRTRPPGFGYAGIGTDGDRNIYTRLNNQANFDTQAQYSYSLSDQLQATTLIGGQFTDITRRINFGTAQGFGTDLIIGAGAAADITAFDESLVNTRRGGLFAQHEFVFDDTYSVSGMIRRDVATALGEGVSDVWYPSASASVQLSNFDAFPDFFTEFRPRVSYGETGELPAVDDGRPLRFGATAAAIGSGGVIGSVGDALIIPERVREIEAGIDIGILDNYFLDLTYWFNSADNSIIDAPLAASTGFGFQSLPQNVGNIQSQGVEATLGLTPLVTEQARLDVDLTYSFQTNEVISLGDEVETIYDGFDRNVIKEGLARSTFFLEEVQGAAFDDDGNALFDGAGNQIVETTGERVDVGNPVPTHTGGLRMDLTLFRNLEISAFAEYALGHQMFNNTAAFGAGSGNYVPRIEAMEALGELTPGSDEYIDAANTLAFSDDRFDANFVEDADWLKIRELSLSYDFTELFLRTGASQITSLRAGVSARNIATFSDYSNPDPEINFDGGRSLSRGQDFLTLQTPRSFTLNVTLGF